MKKSKFIVFAVIILMIVGCSLDNGRTVVEGNIDSMGWIYTTFIAKEYKDGNIVWVEYPKWTTDNSYFITAYRGEVVRVRFQRVFNGEVLATLSIHGNNMVGVKRKRKDIILDGSDYVVY